MRRSASRSLRVLALVLGSALGAGCSLSDIPEPSGEPGGEPGGDACFDPNRAASSSMVVTDPTTLERFSFARVMDRLRASAGVTAQTNPQLFSSWMRTFGATAAAGDCDDPGLDPQGYGLECPRAPEATLAGFDPFAPVGRTMFDAVGVFNRLDLAPGDGAHCGEYRIVFAMRFAPVAGRAFVIFEGAMPNPARAEGVAGCAPLARFWRDLGGEPPLVVADRLEALFFTGGAVPGFPPVVQASHYGLVDGTAPRGAGGPPGQIRTNFFVRDIEWNLREFKLRRTCPTAATCRLAFEHVPAADNPAPELFAGTHPLSAAFRASFVAKAVEPLARLRDGLGMERRFDELESVSSRLDVDFREVASPALRQMIGEQLAALGSPRQRDGQPVTPEAILTRATQQTCAGCHEVSNEMDLGGAVVLPSLGFVHIDEDRRLSRALTARFLPQRHRVMLELLGESCEPGRRLPALGDGRLTLGGSPVGAPN